MNYINLSMIYIALMELLYLFSSYKIKKFIIYIFLNLFNLKINLYKYIYNYLILFIIYIKKIY